ncbi:MAG: hypothetical protein ACR2OU_05385 [Thermomicrobiales bacterium]
MGGSSLTDAFHATTGKQAVRDRVFDLIAQFDIRVDATIFEKRKTVPTHQKDLPLYELAWYQHASKVIPQICDKSEELLVVAASIKTKKEQIGVAASIRDVINQCGRSETSTTVSHWPANTDPCLQVADYCCWAIQRKWELNDDRSHLLIQHLIRREYDMWKDGRTYYY